MERHLNLNLNLSTAMLASANGALFRSACPATISGALSAMATGCGIRGQAIDGKISEATPDSLSVNAKPRAAAPNPTGMQPKAQSILEREWWRRARTSGQRFSRRRKTARIHSENQVAVGQSTCSLREKKSSYSKRLTDLRFTLTCG